MSPIELNKSASFLLEGCENGLFDEDSEELLTLLKLYAERKGVTLRESTIDVLSKVGISFAEAHDNLVTVLTKMVSSH